MDSKFFSKKNSFKNEPSKSIIKEIKELDSDADKEKMERIENICIILPLAVMVFGIIVMQVLYKIFM